MCEPREQGFNYGRGWGSTPKPPVYDRATKVARRLGQEATEKSAQAWRLEMALWKVRIASTEIEKAGAVANLAVELERTLTVIADPVG